MPGLLRGVARTAVVAGTATAVSGRVQRRQAEKYADRDAQIYAEREAAYQQAAPQYAQPQYAQPQYAQPEPQYAAPPPWIRSIGARDEAGFARPLECSHAAPARRRP